MAYLSKRLRGHQVGARYTTTEENLADVLAPGYFPPSAQLNLHDELTVFAMDGGAKTFVAGFTELREPILQVFVQPGAAGEDSPISTDRMAKAREALAAKRAAARAAA